jgi:phage terminase small subunit
LKPKKQAKTAPKKAPKKIQRPAAKKATRRKPIAAVPAAVTLPPAPAAEKTPDEIFAALPLKQRNFIVNYLANGFNATNAAKDAGFSARSADTQGSRLLKNAKVAAVIAARAKKSLAKREVTGQMVLDEIAKLAFFDPRKLFTTDGSLIPITDLGDDEAASIAGVDVKELYQDKCPVGQLKKIKLADKGLNLERLGRYFKLFVEKVEHTHKIERVMVREALKEPRKLPPSKPEFD